MLERRVLELDLGDHVEFDDRFLSIDELSDLLAATDVFVTPYRNREQIASGALTFAIAAGCGVVSTPYWYAQDMLASGAGRLVPFDDPAALADAVCDYVEQPEPLAAARAEARRIGSSLAWPSVAEATAVVLREALDARAAPQAGRRRRPAAHEPAHRPPAHARRRRRHRAARARDHPEPRQRLLRRRRRPARRRLARARAPRRRAGCGRRSSTARSPSCTRPTDEGGMRNFMSYDRRWLDEPHVGDHVGRSVWALGEILATAWIPAVVDPTRDLLGAARRRARRRRLAAHGRVRGARPRAPRRRPARPAGAARCSSASSSSSPTPTSARASDGWRWFEDELTLRQRAALAGADRRRQRARPRRPGRARARVARAGSATSPGSTDDMLRLPGHHGRRRGRAGSGRRRRAAARRGRARRGRARRLRGHARRRARRPRARAPSSGSSAATACSGRSTTSRPAAAATGSAARR